ncbi:MAG: cation:proton antiporter [Anaerotignaceae bacterium]
MESYEFLLVIAIILLSTKTFGILSSHVHMPQVVGALMAGIILGPSCLGILQETDFLLKTSELGVIMLMFIAGLDTDIHELKNTGPTSFIVAVLGVIFPLIGGFGAYMAFFANSFDSMTVLKGIFIGVVLTATSVSITVETLREMGKLKGKVGTTILGAAVIDDILGIIVLSFLSGFTDANANPLMVFTEIGGFFIFLVVVGIVIYYVFKKMEDVVGTKRRVAVYGFAFCLILSYIAEKFFGVADITGAYFAGIILCNIAKTRQYIAKKMTVSSYLLFSPVFFASVGIKTDLHSLNSQFMVFALVLLVIALVTKIIGCGIGAKVCGMSNLDSFRIGVGMVSRGEVALIVAQKGMQAGLIDAAISPAIVLVVIMTTLLTPVMLNFVMKEKASEKLAFKKPIVNN